MLAMLGICLVMVSSMACSRYAATSNKDFANENDRGAQTVLSGSDQSRLLEMMSSTGEREDIRRSRSAPNRMRWSDVPNAVFYAAAEVEMAVVSTKVHDWGIEYQLVTIDDVPGTLRVRRTDDQQVYDADASIGRFVDHPDRAADLLKELRKQMLAFGRKPSLAND